MFHLLFLVGEIGLGFPSFEFVVSGEPQMIGSGPRLRLCLPQFLCRENFARRLESVFALRRHADHKYGCQGGPEMCVHPVELMCRKSIMYCNARDRIRTQMRWNWLQAIQP